MNEQLQSWLLGAKTWLTGLSPQKKILLAVVGCLTLIAGVATSLVMSQDPYQLLYGDLQGEDSKAVTKKLSEQSIPYRASADGSDVFVPASKVSAARMELAKAGVPGQDVVGFEKFDATTIGMSSYIQRIQYIRAVQGELTRSIQRLASVKRARVHISVPPKKTFLEEEEAPKASVVLELKSGQMPSKTETTGIAHLVASAVEGLKVNQVTIVDTKGNFLHKPDDPGNQMMSTALLETQRSIESEYEKRILDILSPVVGMGKVRAKVTAEIDSSRVNTMEETYDPDKAVVKQSLKNDEVTNGSRPNPIGIPGSRSNLPGTENTNPQIPMANSSSEKNMLNNNYAIPKKIQTTDKPSGNIKRLTVAVIVDGYYPKGVGGTTDSFSPRTEEELKRLQEIVANAVGFDTQRRDSITVSSLPFGVPEVLPIEDPLPTGFLLQEFSQHAFRNGLIGLVLMLFFFVVVRPLLRWATVSDIEKEINVLPTTIAELEASRRDEGMLTLSRAAAQLEESEPIEKKEEEELRKKILEKLDNSPRKGIRIVQDWLEEVDQAVPEAA